MPVVTYFKPRGVPLQELDLVLLSLEELEAVRLVDLEGLEQEGAAQRMGISRRALWEDLQNSRRKIAEALVKGKAIEIKGGDYTVVVPRGYSCNGCSTMWNISHAIEQPLQCPKCGGNDVRRNPDNPDDNRPKRCCKGRCNGKEGKAVDEAN